MDVVIPIVFPDYRVNIATDPIEIDIFPGADFDNISIPAFSERVSNLGHAGILIVNGRTGVTRYYEYGRYDRLGRGIVLRIPNLPNARVTKDGVDPRSLKSVLSKISQASGQRGRIQGVFITVSNKFTVMQSHAESKKSQNSSPHRRPYDLLSYNCVHFVKEVVSQAGVQTPWMVDPRPNSYIGEFRDQFDDLDFSQNRLIIEDRGVF